MQVFRVLKGHKKEVLLRAYCPLSLVTQNSLRGIVLSSLRSCYLAPNPPSPGLCRLRRINPPSPLPPTLFPPIPLQTHPGPRATLSQAHDSNVWPLTYHPLGHIPTTRHASGAGPGDTSSVFSGGGEKPPEVADGGGQDEDDDAFMVPGFNYDPDVPGLNGMEKTTRPRRSAAIR